ncbi:CHAT domain-containing protein [Longimicrobium sp.]|uniref:CHAT domain-containing protein n=1 Tax=Longimicrobium sp. TaxID=2029185 RepID=UPI002E33A643|nr:CHAT domain-containing protein [Longimicrobium sp.]HEX6037896.1 CHAT domain-containing protein [Longimicrobium sp.]
MPPTSLSRLLGEHIVRDKEAHDLSRNAEFARFQFLGYRTSATAVELVALCDADGLNEGDVVRLRDEFFDLVRRLPHQYGLKPRGRNPNGLLGFVFADGCPEPMARFIARQTRIDHTANTGGVSVAWAIDVRNERIHTHDNPVSVYPPVVVLARTVYPGLEYLQGLLSGITKESRKAPPTEWERTDAALAGDDDTPGYGRGGRRTGGPVKVLFLAANSQTRPMELEKEWVRIDTDLRMAMVREGVSGKAVWEASMDRLMQALLDESPSILHFSGHGRTHGIVLQSASGEAQVVSGAALGRLLKLFRDTLQCVVLNACWSESQAHAIREHVPHVVGMRERILDSDALAFTSGFYKAIAAGRDVEFAFEMAAANVQAQGNGGERNLVLI